MISIIVATDKNGMIAKDDKIPWYCKEDFKHFKNTTMGGSLIMGRKTFESLTGVLTGRPHIVVSRNREIQLPETVLSAHSLNHAYQIALNLGKENIFVIGGSEIYSLALQGTLVDKIYLSVIDEEIEPNETSKYFKFSSDDFEIMEENLREGFTLKIFKRRNSKFF